MSDKITRLIGDLRRWQREWQLEDTHVVSESIDEIERLQRRVKVLETVILEELDCYDCHDDANEMIVKDIRDRFYKISHPQD